MSVFKYYRSKTKQEVSGLMILSAAQIWLCFNYVPWVKIGGLSSVILPVLASIVTVTFLFYAFSLPEVFGRQLNLEFFDDFPYSNLCKIVFKVLMQAIFHITILYLWYIDFHRCTNTWYAVWCVHCMASFVLFSCAFRRYEKVK